MAPNSDLPQRSGIEPEPPMDLTLAEVCLACEVQSEWVVELVDEGVLAPAGPEPERWRFNVTHLRRVRVASHLQRDLGVNSAGAALAVELLEQIAALHARLGLLGED